MNKTFIIAVAVLAFILLAATCFSEKPTDNADFLRIHIRADSNDAADQAVKYKVKTAVVDYLTPYLTQATSKQKALEIVKSHLGGICAVADSVLSSCGFAYRSSASVTREDFPTRSYDGLVLRSGVYDALVLSLGSGSGDNWWCVVYPPLCFVGSEGSGNVTYKSKILEIIESWRRNCE